MRLAPTCFVFTSLALGSIAAGCSTPTPADDAAHPGDAFVTDGSRHDAGGDAAIDAHVGIDAGIDAALDDADLPDAAMGDAALDDANVGPDAFTDIDAFVGTDAFVDIDAFVGTDAFLGPDAFVGTDAFLGPDAFAGLVGDVCGTAATIGVGTVMGTTVGATNDYGTGTGCSGTAGLDLAYAIVVPDGQRLTLSVVSGDGTFDPSISLVAGPAATCGGSPRACLASDDSGTATTVNRVTWVNTTGATTTVFAIVDNYQASSTGGTFGLTVGIDPVPAGDVCGSATTLAVGTVSGTTVGAANDYGSGTNCTGTGGADVVYAVTVMPSEHVTVSVVSGDGTFDPSINLVAGPAATCGGSPHVCLAGDDSGTLASTNSASFSNTTSTATTIYAIVDSASTTVTGPFMITLATSTIPVGDVCATATTLAVGSTSGTTAGLANDYGSGTNCSGTGGADVVYAVPIAALQRAVITVTSGDGTFDPSISLVAGPAATCGGSPRACISGDDGGSATTVNQAAAIDGTTTATTVYAVVDSASGTATGPFTITLAYEALPAGDVCTNAERISAGSQSGTVVGYANDYGSGTMCAGTAGADHVYVVSVGAGQTLTAAVTTGGSGFDPSISLQTSCGDATRVCVAGDDSGGAATVNMVTHTNSGAAAEDEYIVIDTFSSTTTGTYTLDVMLTP